jgi:hypothetical protein
MEKVVESKSEYEKGEISRKYFEASSFLSVATAYPTMENMKIALAKVSDFIISLPLRSNTAESKKRKEMLDKIKKFEKIVYEGVIERNLLKEYQLKIRTTRDGLSKTRKIINPINLIIPIRELLIEAGEFATELGLRITMPSELLKLR